MLPKGGLETVRSAGNRPSRAADARPTAPSLHSRRHCPAVPEPVATFAGIARIPPRARAAQFFRDVLAQRRHSAGPWRSSGWPGAGSSSMDEAPAVGRGECRRRGKLPGHCRCGAPPPPTGAPWRDYGKPIGCRLPKPAGHCGRTEPARHSKSPAAAAHGRQRRWPGLLGRLRHPHSGPRRVAPNRYQ
jgi:hypothetical protein